MADLLALFRTNIDGVRARRKKIQTELEGARLQREQLRTLLLPAEEIVDVLMVLLDRRAANYQAVLARRVHELSHDFIVHGAQSPGAQIAGILSDNVYAIAGPGLEMMFAYLCRDQVRASLLKAIKGLGRKAGSPRAERVRQLAQVEERIKDLEEQEKAVQAELDVLRKEIDG